MNAFDKFLFWEAKSRDTIDFKKVYVDIAGDLVAGLLLSQIIYWYLPDEHGKTKLRVQKDGHLWIAKGRDDWWQEIRITAKQFDRASKILIDKGIIAKGHFRFDGFRMVHIRLDYDQFMELWQAQLEPPAIDLSVNPQLPKGKTRNYPKVKPLTESTTKSTTDNGSVKNSQISKIPTLTQNEKDDLNILATYIGKETNVSTGDKEAKERLKATTLLGYEIAKICELIISIIDHADQRMMESLVKVAISLFQNNVTPDDLEKFNIWWYDNTWQGRKGQTPSPIQIASYWGQYEAQRVINVPITTDGGFYV